MACAAPVRLTIQSSESRFLSLSKREQSICRRLAMGYSGEEIARQDGISHGNLRSMLERTRKREGVVNTMRLVVRYLDEYCGLLESIEDLPDTDPTRRESDATA